MELEWKKDKGVGIFQYSERRRMWWSRCLWAESKYIRIALFEHTGQLRRGLSKPYLVNSPCCSRRSLPERRDCLTSRLLCEDRRVSCWSLWFSESVSDEALR
jgi:hypothetical protein